MLFTNRYSQTILQARQAKDRFVQSAADSPLPWEERHHFTGLRYFPPNRSYRLTAQIALLPESERVALATSDGQEQWYLRYARLHFKIDRQPYQLVAYRSAHEHGAHPEIALFVPFRDALAGRETYGSGRYLDLGYDPHASPESLIVDFNLAYNPYCAYSSAYSCPIPPRENWLTCAIRAGERSFHMA